MNLAQMEIPSYIRDVTAYNISLFKDLFCLRQLINDIIYETITFIYFRLYGIIRY